uniref:Uncharacterized protein n=1 Tax=viral metagenome TaxID=1070528 RepID=A0A6H1ZMV4_9ZZZZ
MKQKIITYSLLISLLLALSSYAFKGLVIDCIAENKGEIKVLKEKKVDNNTLQMMIESQGKMIQLQIEQQKKDSDRMWQEIKDIRKEKQIKVGE